MAEGVCRAVGSIANSLEEYRDTLQVNLMEQAIQDLRLAVRQLRRNPGVTCTAVAVLALGIAATVGIFGFVEAALIRALPYRDDSRLVALSTTTLTGTRGLVSYLDYRDWERLNHAFTSLGAYDVRSGFTLNRGERSRRVTGMRVTAGFFRTLGVTPALGRDFDANADHESATPTVLLSYGAWQSQFGGMSDVVGQSVSLDGVPHVVIGVLPRTFYFAPAGSGEFWTTIRGANPCWHMRRCQSLGAIARLRDGVSLETALADMRAVAKQLEQQYPETNRNKTAVITSLRESLVGDVRPAVMVLFSGAGLLLLIAAMNVGNLLLVHSAKRAREIGVRKAVGASRARLVLQFAAEGVVLVVMSAVLGLIGAEWTMRFLSSLISTEMTRRMPYLEGVGVSAGSVLVTGLICLSAAILFTVIPAWRVSRAENAQALHDGTRGSGARTWRRFGAQLIVVELAVAVVLLVGAGLLGRSLYRMFQVDTGLDPNRVITASIGLPSGTLAQTKGDEVAALAERIETRIAAIPGVQSVGFADLLPLSSSGAWPPVTAQFRLVGREDRGEANQATARSISSDYFLTLGARLVRGRHFAKTDDASTPPVAIINETMAEQLFGAAEPIGQQVVRGDEPPMEIVGVVADIQEGAIETAPRPAVYVPFVQRPNSGFGVAVRTNVSTGTVASSLPAAIREIGPDISVAVLSMADRINALPSAYLRRSSAWLVGSFASMALLLSVIGLYGVISYSVAQRTREIGVRIALGAQTRSVYRLVLGQAAWLIAIGTALGIACSAAAGRFMRGLLFGVNSWDVPTLVIAAGVLVSASLLASYVPARRAASVDPVDVLRAE